MKQIERIRAQYEDALLALPNVVAVALGERAGREVIKVFVSRKVRATELEPHQRIPTQLEGSPLVIEEMGSPSALD